MDGITVGVLTISDRCHDRVTVDESGPKLKNMVEGGVLGKASVVRSGIVPDSKERIARVLREWTNDDINLILTTGGTGISERDVTPEATLEELERTIPGMSHLILQRSLDVTQFAALSRGIAGIKGKTLIINLPGSKKASQECLEAVAKIIPHSIDLIRGNKGEVQDVHTSLEQKKSQVVVDNYNCKNANPYPCVSVKEAHEIIQDRLFLMRKEKTVRYDEALGYILEQDAIARDDLPPFACSTRDGYAVRSSDMLAIRKQIGISNAGASLPSVEVRSGECLKISTGAGVPPGADAVVQVEDTSLIEGSKVSVIKKVVEGENVRMRGSDFRSGQILMPCKTYLDSAAVGLLAAAGLIFVRVFDKPLVAILSTGDEVVNPDETLKPGQVRDSNRITLLSLMKEENFKAVDLGIVEDNPDALRDALERGFGMADVVVTTGGMSMGERDYVKEVIEADFGGDICFGRVWMKPGKPTALAIVTFQGKQKLWFGLPGNPASALVASHLFLLPALRKISGWEKIFPESTMVQLWGDVPEEDRPQYVRGVLTSVGKRFLAATVMADQKSSNIGNCIRANCLIEIPGKLPNATTASSTPGLKTQSKNNTSASSLPSFLGSSTTSHTEWNSPDYRNFGLYNAKGLFSNSKPNQDSGVEENTKFVKAFVIGKMYG